MKWRVLAFALAFASPAGALTRTEAAKRFAPVIYQEVHDARDLHVAFDFDGNWAGEDNGANGTCAADQTQCQPGSPCEDGKCPLVGTVYFTVIETDTHFFVQYMPYHALDSKTVAGHEHDTESVLVVGTKAGEIQAYELLFHTEWFVYANAPVMPGAKMPDGPLHLDASGRPKIYMQQVGHGMCGGFSPPNNQYPDLQLDCRHAEDPHIEGTGVVYRPDLPATTPALASGAAIDAGYTLVEMLDAFWARRAEVGTGKTFKSLADFKGERCDVLACPKQYGAPFMTLEDDAPGPPWNQQPGDGVNAVGDQFFDPAFTMNIRLTFPEPFSRDYCHNPYVGVTARCAEDPAQPAKPDGGATTAPPPGGETTPPESNDAPKAEGGGSGCAMSSKSDASLVALLVAFVIASRRCGIRRRSR